MKYKEFYTAELQPHYSRIAGFQNKIQLWLEEGDINCLQTYFDHEIGFESFTYTWLFVDRSTCSYRIILTKIYIE